jgi:two-component system, NarL family, nitrate/nitrite sensor histidine kinase NarX
MRKSWSLSRKLGVIGGVLLLMALVSIGLTLWVTWQLEGGAAAVNEAGRMRMQTWRLAQTLDTGDAQRVAQLSTQFEDTLRTLRLGDPERPLVVPRDPESQKTFLKVQQAWLELKGRWLSPARPEAAEVSQQADAFVREIDEFVSAIESKLASLTAVLNSFQFIMAVLVMVSAVTLLYSAYLFIFNPLQRLQSGLARVGAGDLAARVEVLTQDEFGVLSDGFNRMAQTLQGLYHHLEDKVREKTLSLEAQHARLAALYEAAAFVARPASMEALAQGFAKLLRRVAGADGSAVRWSDESHQHYIMMGADGVPKELVEGEHCLVSGDCGCGSPEAKPQTRVIQIQALDAQGLGNYCQRAGYARVVSVPVRLQERLVGEINLFFRHSASLSTEDQTLLETLASHLAGAIESLRASALERETAVSQERAFLARELHDSIAQGLAFLQIQVGMLRHAIDQGKAERVQRILDELNTGVQDSLSDVRELLLHFRTRPNTEDIEPAVQTTLRKFEHQTGLTTHLALQGRGLPLAPDVQVQVLHVLQEALSNVRKHAQARNVWVELQQGPNWRMHVRDDGRGFDAGDPSTDETHVGLGIMRERAQRIGAQVEFTSSPGTGTCVTLSLSPPLEQSAPSST